MTAKSPRLLSQERTVSVKPDFVRVNGRYRVGRLLGSGVSGEPNSGSTHLADRP
jgi:hypothetical protein